MALNKKTIIIATLSFLILTGLVYFGLTLILDKGKISPEETQAKIIKEKITENPITITSNGDKLVASNSDYSILYMQELDEFRVIITNPKFYIAKTKAEEDFLNMVEGNKPLACSLNVSIIAGPQIQLLPNEPRISQLSFCVNDNTNL